MTHRSGNSVCATTESSVLEINLSSFLAGVMRTYFMSQNAASSQRPTLNIQRSIKRRGQRSEDIRAVKSLNIKARDALLKSWFVLDALCLVLLHHRRKRMKHRLR